MFRIVIPKQFPSCAVSTSTVLQYYSSASAALQSGRYTYCTVAFVVAYFIPAAEAFITDFDKDPERQVDTFLLGQLTQPQKSQDKTEQI